MFTWRAIQGGSFAQTVDFSGGSFVGSETLAGKVSRGDGQASLLDFTPTWNDVAEGQVDISLTTANLATLGPGPFFVYLSIASGPMVAIGRLNVILGAGTGTVLRSLITPAEAAALLPDLLTNPAQFDAMPDLLEAATVTIENHCDRTFILQDFDQTFPVGTWGLNFIDLEYPVASITSITYGPAGWPIDEDDFTAIDPAYYTTEPNLGKLSIYPRAWNTSFTTAGNHTGSLVRVVYRAGYAILYDDIDLGIPQVPKDLRKACAMIARSIQEGALTSGPVKTQTVRDRSYTKTESPQTIPAEAIPILDRYCRKWVVAQLGWPTIPEAMVNDFVIIERANEWTQDSHGGKRITYGAPSRPISCFITPNVAGEKTEAFRDSPFARYAVTFNGEDPGVHLRDRITWIETGKLLTVVGTEVGGDASSRQYHVYTEENATR